MLDVRQKLMKLALFEAMSECGLLLDKNYNNSQLRIAVIYVNSSKLP